MESEETILEPIVTGHHPVYAVVYTPRMALIATGDGIRKSPRLTLHDQSKSGTQTLKTSKLERHELGD
jgi:hypothetical protein